MRKNRRDPNQLEFDLPYYRTRQLLRCSTPPVENDMHHISRDSRGRWEVRFTASMVSPDGRELGGRYRWRLSKRLSAAEAKQFRDGTIAGLRRLGFHIAERQLVRGCRIDP